ncbi:uncharacterized protein [Castor canadensis]|uniref:Uncharacterized protein n=1 Tax=Castor canadensis TaxID=51338 RepID=A0AC58LJ88_CASCN
MRATFAVEFLQRKCKEHPEGCFGEASALGFFSPRKVCSRARTCPSRCVHPARPACPAWRIWESRSASQWLFGATHRAMPASSTIHVLQLLRELLAFVLLSYTVLIGALLLAGWTTYFLVLK